MVLIAASVSIFLSVWMAVGLNKSLERQILAGQIANREIEKIKAKSFSEILPTSSPISDPALSRLPQAAGTTTISNYLSTSTLKSIDVLVTWQERGEKRFRLNTVVAEGTTHP